MQSAVEFSQTRLGHSVTERAWFTLTLLLAKTARRIQSLQGWGDLYAHGSRSQLLDPLWALLNPHEQVHCGMRARPSAQREEEVLGSTAGSGAAPDSGMVKSLIVHSVEPKRRAGD